MPLLTVSEQYVLPTACFPESYLAAIDDSRNFYVATGSARSILNAEYDQSVRGILTNIFRRRSADAEPDKVHHFVTYTSEGNIERDVSSTPAELVSELGVTHDAWANASDWSRLHANHNVFGTASPLYFGDQLPFPYMDDIRSAYLPLCQFDIRALESIDNPHWARQADAAKQITRQLQPLEVEEEIGVMRALEGRGFREILGLYADVPKAWTYLAEDLCLVVRERRLLTVDDDRKYTAQTLVVDAVRRAKSGRFDWQRLPADGMGWIANVTCFFRTRNELFAQQLGQSYEWHDVELQRVQWDEGAIRYSIGEGRPPNNVLRGITLKSSPGTVMVGYATPFAEAR